MKTLSRAQALTVSAGTSSDSEFTEKEAGAFVFGATIGVLTFFLANHQYKWFLPFSLPYIGWTSVASFSSAVLHAAMCSVGEEKGEGRIAL